MRKTAFLSFDWDYEITSLFYKGMEEYLSTQRDVQLVIFNAFAAYDSYEPEQGSFEVFSLCDIDQYDGYIIQGNRLWPPDLRQAFADAIRAEDKPIVSISYELDGACYVGTDNYVAMRGLVERVLTDHHCTKAAYVNGLATSLEAQDRARGFKDACVALGVTDARFYQASWQMEEGIKAAHEMLERPDDLPEVVFCCNDLLAVGIQRTMAEHGVRVPEDVMVTGFDNREIVGTVTPRVASVDRDYATTGRTAMQTLIRLMDGEQLTHVASPVRYVLTRSCGYPDAPEESEAVSMAHMQTTYQALTHFFRLFRRFQPAVLEASSLEQILSEGEHFLRDIGCSHVYVSINDDYLKYDATRTTATYGTTSTLRVRCDTEVKISSEEEQDYKRFVTKSLLPADEPMDAPVYMVFPLRYDTNCIGTLVTEGVSPILQYGFITIILKLLSSAIENMRKKEVLRNLNLRLDNLYVHDQLTGLFNRFGLQRFGGLAYDHLLRDFALAVFIFVDIDSMKQINDVYGHEIGDLAIRDTADIIQRSMRNENAFAMRYGGDEFLLICRYNIIPKIEGELEHHKRTNSRPYDLGLSMGAYEVRASDHRSMEEAIELADERMYQVKRKRKGLK